MSVLLFIIIFILINHFIGSKLNSFENKDIYSDTKWNEFYKLDSNSLDIIMAGSSHCYRSYDPYIFNKELNVSSFNMGSPLQKPVESYYIIKEVLRYHQPKVLIFDTYWGIFNDEKYFNTKTFNYDMLKPSLNKVNYFLNVFNPDQYAAAMSYTLRYHERLYLYLRYLLTGQKNTVDKAVYLKNYKGKGFVINNEIVDADALLKKYEKHNPKQGKSYKWDNKQMDYFIKIIDLCKRNNIKLILVTAPLNPIHIEHVDTYLYDYDIIHNTISQIAIENQLTYIDYNILNKKENIVSNNDFSDTNHLNYTGAIKISNHLTNLIKDEVLSAIKN